MALVKCIECGSEISDQAIACPRCGAPGPAAGQINVRAAPRRKARAWPWVLGSIIFGIVVMAMFGSGGGESVGTSASGSSGASSYWVDYAARKRDECLSRGYPVPDTWRLGRQKWCETYGNVQALCKHDGKTGGACE